MNGAHGVVAQSLVELENEHETEFVRVLSIISTTVVLLKLVALVMLKLNTAPLILAKVGF